jgi:hypothetical protein
MVDNDEVEDTDLYDDEFAPKQVRWVDPFPHLAHFHGLLTYDPYNGG